MNKLDPGRLVIRVVSRRRTKSVKALKRLKGERTIPGQEVPKLVLISTHLK